MRLLTYNVPDESGYGILQMGKPIADQMRVLNQFVSGLLLVGAISILVLGFGSWWMAGRSLRCNPECLGYAAGFCSECQS